MSGRGERRGRVVEGEGEDEKKGGGEGGKSVKEEEEEEKERRFTSFFQLTFITIADKKNLTLNKRSCS